MADFPYYAPDFKIRINDADLPAAVRSTVTSVTYQDGMNAADRVEVGLANLNLRWLKSHIEGLNIPHVPGHVTVSLGPEPEKPPGGIFNVNNSFSLAMGYAPDNVEEMFSGEVTGIRASFPGSGVPSMTIVAHDRLHRLMKGSKARGFGPLDDAVIAAMISAEHKLRAEIDPKLVSVATALNALNVIFQGTGIKQVAPGLGQSDFELIQEIATRYNADVKVEADRLMMSIDFLKALTPKLTLTWGESLLNFSPEVSTVGDVDAVTAKFSLRELPLSFLVTVSWNPDRGSVEVSIAPGKTGSGNGGRLTIMDQPITCPADIQNSAREIMSQLRAKANNRMTGRGSTVGDPRIRAGTLIRLEGLGPDFSGNYRVVSTTHTIDSSGYRTDFQGRKEVIP